jgi:hypothetical protein
MMNKGNSAREKSIMCRPFHSLPQPLSDVDRSREREYRYLIFKLAETCTGGDAERLIIDPPRSLDPLWNRPSNNFFQARRA